MMVKRSEGKMKSPAVPIVAMCSVGELFGGVERHLLGMCEWFRRQGIKPLLILFHDRELAAQARESGFDPVVLESRGSFDLGVPRKLAELLREHKVNLVHTHGYRAMVNVALARRQYPFSVVRTVHGLVEPAPFLSLPWIKGNLYSWLEKTASKSTKATDCYVTEDLRIRYLGSGEGTNSFSIHNGIDPVGHEEFPRPLDLAEGVFNFAAVGRVSAVKNLETALHAMKIFDPETRAVLNIIGTGPSLEELKALADELQLGDRVRFLGFKANIYDYLAHIDALLMPSLHEGLPYTILETMSLGTPIIASSVGGLAEILEEGTTARLVSSGDTQGWAKAMMDLVKDPESAQILGKNGLEKQAESFSLESMGQAYWDIYLKKTGM